MNYEGPVIRPPSEANSLILQVTVGCSHNRCTFCPAYKGRRFRIKGIEEIRRDIEEASLFSAEVRRVFLADGDALIIPQPKLLEIVNCLHRRFPALQRIGSYANAKSILRKSVEELKELKAAQAEHHLPRHRIGRRRNPDAAVHKGATVETMVEAASG